MKLFSQFLRSQKLSAPSIPEPFDPHPMVVLDHLRTILGPTKSISVELSATAGRDTDLPSCVWKGSVYGRGLHSGVYCFNAKTHVGLVSSLLSQLGRDLSEEVLRAQCEALGYELVKKP